MSYALKICGRSVALVVAIAAAAAAQTSTFQTALTSPLGGAFGDALPILAVGDVGSPLGNRAPDGKLDLVTGEIQAGVQVLLGFGDGTFAATPSISVSGLPTAVVLGDFDGDQVLDLVVADNNDNVTFLHGNNDGTFSPRGAPIPIGALPAALVAADFDHDQNLDLALAVDGSSSGGVAILRGDGHGGFTPHGTCVAGSNPGAHCIVPTDCHGGGTCVGGTTVTGLAPTALALGKFGGDTAFDLASADSDGNTVSVLRGDGTGGFAVVQTLTEAPNGLQPIAVIAQDVNGDGRPDLVVANQGSDNIAVFDGLAAGTFDPTARLFPSAADKSAPSGLVLADVNHDGHLDAVIANNFGGDVSVLLGDGNGNFGRARNFMVSQQPMAIASGNFNQDSLPDIVTIDQGTPNQGPDAGVLLGKADGTLAGVEDIVVQPDPPVALAVGDADNDGIPDLIVADRSPNLAIYTGDPSSGFGPPSPLTAAGPVVAVATGDFNGDGLLDIAALAAAPPTPTPGTNLNLSVFLGGRAGFAAPQNYALGSGASALVSGDWNGDGRADLAVARQGSPSSAAGSVTALLANADGSLQPQAPFSVNPSPLAIDSGDFDHNGTRDLVVVNINSVALFLGNGHGAFQAAASQTFVGSGSGVAVGDFDHDGFDDVAVALFVAGKVLIYYGDGTGGFRSDSPHMLRADSPRALAARDVTGDLIPDLLVTDDVGNSVTLFVARAGRDPVMADVVTAGRRPLAAAAADFTLDGRYDGAAANGFGAGSVSVLTNISAASAPRGDGNGDKVVTAADATALIRKLGAAYGTTVEHAGSAGADANGDGILTKQDTLALAHRLFGE